MDRAVTTPALQSIQRYMIVGMFIVAFVTFGVGGWAATSQLSGAVIGQGVVVVDSSVKDRDADAAAVEDGRGCYLIAGRSRLDAHGLRSGSI